MCQQKKEFHHTLVPYCAGIILTLLTACSSDMSDLERFVADTKARKNPNVDPLPKFEIVPNYFYEVDNMRDPFEPLMEQSVIIQTPTGLTGTPTGDTPCPKPPDSNRVRVGLELMPLDALQMVGTLKEGETLWGLVISKTKGTLYKVKVGEFMGQYFGKVIAISETKIEVMEFVPDNNGCYSEQANAIKLR